MSCRALSGYYTVSGLSASNHSAKKLSPKGSRQAFEAPRDHSSPVAQRSHALICPSGFTEFALHSPAKPTHPLSSKRDQFKAKHPFPFTSERFLLPCKTRVPRKQIISDLCNLVTQ